jgi:hypothetical protein
MKILCAVLDIRATLKFLKGMGDRMSQMLDGIGVPEFFYTTIGKTEDAGGGCVRIYCCIERGGMLIPQLTVVMPAESLIIAARRAGDAALEAFTEARAGLLVH